VSWRFTASLGGGVAPNEDASTIRSRCDRNAGLDNICLAVSADLALRPREIGNAVNF